MNSLPANNQYLELMSGYKEDSSLFGAASFQIQTQTTSPMHVDCDPDSNPDSGPGAHVNAAYGPARLHKDSDSDLDPDWLCLHGGKLDSNPCIYYTQTTSGL